MVLKISSYIPLLTSLLIVVLICFGYIELGHLPKYGFDPDPYITFSKNFFQFKNYLLLVLLVLLYFSPLCMIFTIAYFWSRKSKREIFKYIGLYLIGGVLFFMLRPSSPFMWLLD